MLLEDWMRVVIDTCGFYISNIMHNLDGGLSFVYSETLSSKCFLIDQRVEICKASTELDLFAIAAIQNNVAVLLRKLVEGLVHVKAIVLR